MSKIHSWLAQKVCIRPAHDAVSSVSADALLKKTRRKKAGECIRAINAIQMTDSGDILAGGKVSYCWFRALLL